MVSHHCLKLSRLSGIWLRMKMEINTQSKSKAHRWSWQSECIGEASVLPQGPSSHRHPWSRDTGPCACCVKRGPWRTQHQLRTVPCPPVRTESLDWSFPHLIKCQKHEWRKDKAAHKLNKFKLHSQAPPCTLNMACLPVHFLRPSSYFIPGRVSLHLKSSSQNSANQMFLLLFSRDLEVKYWSNPEWFHKHHLVSFNKNILCMFWTQSAQIDIIVSIIILWWNQKNQIFHSDRWPWLNLPNFKWQVRNIAGRLIKHH